MNASLLKFVAITTHRDCRYARFAAFAESVLDVHALSPLSMRCNTTDMWSQCGHGAKLQTLAEFAETLDVRQMVIYADAYDSVVVAPLLSRSSAPKAFLERYAAATRSAPAGTVLVAAECNDWVWFGKSRGQREMQSRTLAAFARRGAFPRACERPFTGEFAWLNAGGIMGPAGPLARLLRGALATYGTRSRWNGESDQAVLSAAYALGLDPAHHAPPVVLDSRHRLFSTASWVMQRAPSIDIDPGGQLDSNCLAISFSPRPARSPGG
jgi:hypothetical protein